MVILTWQHSNLSGRPDKLIRYVTLDLSPQQELMDGNLQNDNVLTFMTKFRRRPSQKYSLITPQTPLQELEDFLKDNLFALSTLRFDHLMNVCLCQLNLLPSSYRLRKEVRFGSGYTG